jgi:plasmid stabilization system protein ParE
MVWRVDFAPGSERDFAIILNHLTNAYLGLGEAPASAVARAIERVRAIRSNADRLGLAPGVGALRDDIGEGLRHVAFDRAIYWFTADAGVGVVTVLAVFLAGEDHHHKARTRLRRGFGRG